MKMRYITRLRHTKFFQTQILAGVLFAHDGFEIIQLVSYSYTGLDVSDDKSDMCARLIIWKSRFMANDGVIIFNDLASTRVRVYEKNSFALRAIVIIFFFVLVA